MRPNKYVTEQIRGAKFNLNESRSGGRDGGWTMAFVRHTIDINGCKLSFMRGGKGSPLLYLHGTDGLAEWPAILDTLAERFDVIVPDHPGFGASEAPAWICLLYTSPSPRDGLLSRMPSSA